jgi:hypothetical protein
MVSAVVGISAVAVVSTVFYTSSTGVSTSSGVQVLPAFPAVPVLSCAGVHPVALTAVDVPGILAVAITSAAAAILILLSSRLLLMFLTYVSGVLANLFAVGDRAVSCVPVVVNTAFPPVWHPCCSWRPLLFPLSLVMLSNPAVPVIISAVDVESLLWHPILTSLMLLDVS